MRRALSLRYDRVLAGSEREALASVLISLAVTPTSWSLATQLERTYLRCEYEGEVPAAASLAPTGCACLHAPPLVVLEVIPAGGAGLAALEQALGGAGRPLGIVSCERSEIGLVVELEDAVTPLDLVVALVDAELRGRPRRIVPLMPLEDGVLARFAGARLSVDGLDASSLIETHAEPLLRA